MVWCVVHSSLMSASSKVQAYSLFLSKGAFVFLAGPVGAWAGQLGHCQPNRDPSRSPRCKTGCKGLDELQSYLLKRHDWTLQTDPSPTLSAGPWSPREGLDERSNSPLGVPKHHTQRRLQRDGSDVDPKWIQAVGQVSPVSPWSNRISLPRGEEDS